jgi:hypothetical protein
MSTSIPMPMWVCLKCGFTLPASSNRPKLTCRKCQRICYPVEYAEGEIILLNEEPDATQNS